MIKDLNYNSIIKQSPTDINIKTLNNCKSIYSYESGF